MKLLFCDRLKPTNVAIKYYVHILLQIFKFEGNVVFKVLYFNHSKCGKSKNLKIIFVFYKTNCVIRTQLSP